MFTQWRKQFVSTLLVVTFFVAMISVAQAAIAPPNILSYQGRLLNSNGVPVTSSTASIKFKLYDSASGGTCLWSNSSSTCATETAHTVTLSSGLFSENLGDTAASYAAIPSTVFADNAAVYLGITIGSDSEMSPRKRMTAAPYALNAQTLDGLDSTSFMQTGVAISGASPFVFEGAIDDAFETTFAITNPTAGNTITFKNGSGTVAFLSDITNISADSLNFTDFADALTLDAATTISGNILSLNENSNFAVNINTGTSSGALTLGGGSGTVAINSSDWDIDATGVMTGIGNTTIDGIISVNPALISLPVQDGSTSTQWGALFGESASTVTYTGGQASESLFMFNGFAQPTLESSVTTAFTNAATMYIANAPVAGTNTTILNPYALVVAAGNTKLGGDLALNGGNMTTSSSTFNLIDSVTTLSIGASATEIDIANNNGLGHTIKIGGNTDTNLIRIGSSAEDGGNTAADTIRIATGSGGADTIQIGNSNASTLLSLTGGDDWSITSAGVLTVASCSGCSGGGFVDGNVTSPSIAFSADASADTGFYRIGENNIGVATNGVKVVDIGATTIDLGATTATTLHLGAGGAIARAINIGTGTGADTITIGGGTTGADTIHIGNNLTNLSSIVIGGTGFTTNSIAIGADLWKISADGVASFDSIASTSTSATVSLFTTLAAGGVLDFADATPTLNIQKGAGSHTLNIGGTGADTISIATNNTTSDTVFIGNTALVTNVSLTGGSAGGVFINDFAGTTKTYIGGNGGFDGTDTVQISTDATSADTLTFGNANTGTTLALTGGNDWSITTAGALSIGVGGKFTVAATGIAAANLNATATTNGLCHSGANVDAATDTTRDLVACSGAPGDYAEWHETDGTVQSGDIVAVTGGTFTYSASESDAFTGEILPEKTQKTLPILTAATSNQSEDVLGVVSTSPNQTIGSDVRDQGAHPQPIALVGRVPVNVTNENGSIQVGDYITTSSVPGKGMKATLAGRVIGIALTGMSGASGQVTVQVTNSWYFGALIGNDGTSTLLTDTVVVAPLQNASASTQTFDSYGLALRGSAWDGNQAQAVSMMFKNKVTDGTNYRLSVRNTTDSEVAYITNTGTMQVAGDMVVGGKIYPSNLGGIQTDKYIYYDGSTGPGGDFMRTNASGWSTGSYDFAEMFPSSDSLVPGDVVVFSSTNIHVKRSTKKDEKSIAGIVSTRPGFLAGENTPGSYPIALAGRVPTNVNNENGSIAVGDPLTTSSASGVAMKATEPGPIVGYALEPFDGTNGSITVFVSAGYWGGDATSSTPGADNRASLFGSSHSESMTMLSMSGNINMNGNEISNIGRMAGLSNSWSIEVDGTIKTEALLKTVIVGQNNQKVETIATTSPEAIITLSGSSTLKDGMVEVRFVDVNKDFGNVISAIAPIRVVATPNGPVSLYVSEKDQNHFVVKSFGGNASDVEFDWVVTGYRKGFEPKETTNAQASVAAESFSESNLIQSSEQETTSVVSETNTVELSDVSASSPSASTTTVDPSVINVDALAPTLSP